MNSPENITKLQSGIERTLTKFAAIEEAEQTTHEQASTSSESQERSKSAVAANGPSSTLTSEQPTRNNSVVGTKRKHLQINESLPEPTTHFPKFLTSPKLLQLEVSYRYVRFGVTLQSMPLIPPCILH